MAIKITINFKGLVVSSAYVRVMTPMIMPGNTCFQFTAHLMATSETEALTSVAYEAPYNLSGANPLEQAYEYLKTLDEYTGSEDC